MDDAGFGRIRSKGDQALFGGRITQEMKEKLGVSDKRPLADFLPTLTIAAKNLATDDILSPFESIIICSNQSPQQAKITYPKEEKGNLLRKPQSPIILAGKNYVSQRRKMTICYVNLSPQSSQQAKITYQKEEK